MTSPRIARARSLRQRETYAEDKLWAALRGGALCVRFRRQHPVGRHISDFACVPARLVVEVDGRIHERREFEDLERTGAIEALGWTVLRVPNDAVLADVTGVLARIREALRA